MRAFSYASPLPVTWQRWRSHNSIRRSRKPYATLRVHYSMFCRTRVIADRSFTQGIRIFDLFGSCDLDLDRMTFIYELNPYPLETYRMCENERFTSRRSKVIVWRAANASLLNWLAQLAGMLTPWWWWWWWCPADVSFVGFSWRFKDLCKSPNRKVYVTGAHR